MTERKAVLFDLFGTLVPTVLPGDYEGMLMAVADALGVPRGPFSVQWRAEIQLRESGGLGGVEAMLASTAVRAGHSPSAAAVERAARTWLDVASRWLEPREGAIDAIRAFRQVGYRVGLVSNCSAEVPRLWPASPLSAVVDAPVFSCEAGAMKPDSAIYQRVCALLEAAPEDGIYVGDGGAHELTAAAALGMTAVLIRVPGEEHTWFDANYRKDAMEWQGDAVADIQDLGRYIAR